MPLLPPWPLFSAFLLASVVLAVTPGPGVIYIVTCSVTQGRRAGLMSVLGVALGNLGNAVAASLGVAAVLAVSPLAFTVLTWAGAAYLIVMGVQMWRRQHAASTSADTAPVDDPQRGPAAPPATLLRDGFLVALLNPKTTLFFAAFLPQFLSPSAGGSAVGQSLLLGTLFVAVAACSDGGYALAAGAAARWLAGHRAASVWGTRLSALMFIGLGLLALRTSAPPH